jgi:hypothetical protein
MLWKAKWKTPINKKQDADACRYFTQVTFGAVLVILSMIQLIREADNQSVWMSTLSATIATFLPHPEIKKEYNQFTGSSAVRWGYFFHTRLYRITEINLGIS